MNSRDLEMAAAIEQAEEADETESDDRVYVRPRPPREPSHVYSVRIPVERLEELRRLAERRGSAPTVLIREWVIEKLEAEKSLTIATTFAVFLHPAPGMVPTESVLRQMERQYELV